MADEFKIVLGAELKPDASSSINAQIKTLESQIKPMSVQIQLNSQSYQRILNQINNIRNQLQGLNNININIGNGGNNGGGVNNVTTTATNMQRAFREVANLYKQITAMEGKVGKLGLSGLDANNITAYKQQLNTLRHTYNQLITGLSSGNVNLANIFTGVNEAKTTLATLSRVVDNFHTKTAAGIRLNINSGKLISEIQSIEQSFNSLNSTDANVINNLNRLRDLLNTMGSNNSAEAITASYRQFNQILDTTKIRLKELQEQSKLEQDRNALSAQMSVWLQKNSAAARSFGGTIRNLQTELQNCNKVRFDQIKTQFNQIDTAAKLAGLNVKSFGDRLKLSFTRLSAYFSAYRLIGYTSRALRSMYNNVVEIDTAMTGLRRVTNLTEVQYSALYDKMTDSAKKYGSTLQDIITSTADWVRLGFDTEPANQLAGITAMYQHVTDLDNDTAVNNLVTAYKGFQNQLMGLYNNDSVAAIEYVADIYDKLGNEFAVTAADVGTALSKSASALQLAGNTIQESAAMATGITEVTQDAAKAGSSLKILSMRLRGKIMPPYKESLYALFLIFKNIEDNYICQNARVA